MIKYNYRTCWGCHLCDALKYKKYDSALYILEAETDSYSGSGKYWHYVNIPHNLSDIIKVSDLEKFHEHINEIIGYYLSEQPKKIKELLETYIYLYYRCETELEDMSVLLDMDNISDTAKTIIKKYNDLNTEQISNQT